MLSENVWVDKYKYADAEEKYYVLLSKYLFGGGCLMLDKAEEENEIVEVPEKAPQLGQANFQSEKKYSDIMLCLQAETAYNEWKNKNISIRTNQIKGDAAAGSIAVEIAKARQHIQKSLGSDHDKDSGAQQGISDVMKKITFLEKTNSDLQKAVDNLTKTVNHLSVKLSALEKHTSVTSQPKHPEEPKVEDKKKDDDDDDIDLFGSDSEEEDEEAKKKREEKLAAYAEKKAKKPGPIPKSNVIFDVKPWDDETDMKEMERRVRTVSCDGLLWGASQLVPLAYGIQKLRISSVVEDEKVSIDWIQETIEQFEDIVQSVDIAAFNKI